MSLPLDEKTLAIYNSTLEISKTVNTTEFNGIINPTKFVAAQDKAQVSQLNNLILLGSVGFSKLFDQLENLRLELYNLNLETKASLRQIFEQQDKLSKQVERIQKDLSIQPSNSSQNSGIEALKELTQRIAEDLSVVKRDTSLIPKDIEVSDNIKPIVERIQHLTEDLNHKLENQSRGLDHFSISVIDKQNSIIQQLEKAGLKGIENIKSQRFITYDPPQSA